MTDSLRTDGSRAIDDASDADRDAKIEQLLLAGLDHYFSERYEHAINVWTRALFLDRSHARARAYIDRARSALAERQRQSEELLQSGVAALDGGREHEARRLLQAAVDHGARADDIHPLLVRLNREPHAVSVPVNEGRVKPDGRAQAALTAPLPLRPSARRAESRRWATAFSVMTLLSAVAAGTRYIVATRDGLGVRSLLGQDAPVTAAPFPASRETPLPLPRRGETALGRARALALRGRLHEALSALDLVRATDPEKGEADRVRGDIQRQLLRLAATPPPAPALRDKGEPRQP